MINMQEFLKGFIEGYRHVNSYLDWEEIGSSVAYITMIIITSIVIMGLFAVIIWLSK